MTSKDKPNTDTKKKDPIQIYDNSIQRTRAKNNEQVQTKLNEEYWAYKIGSKLPTWEKDVQWSCLLSTQRDWSSISQNLLSYVVVGWNWPKERLVQDSDSKHNTIAVLSLSVAQGGRTLVKRCSSSSTLSPSHAQLLSFLQAWWSGYSRLTLRHSPGLPTTLLAVLPAYTHPLHAAGFQDVA